MCVCVCARARVCVCTCVRARAYVCVCACGRACVFVYVWRQACDGSVKHKTEMVSRLEEKTNQLVSALKEMEKRSVLLTFCHRAYLSSSPTFLSFSSPTYSLLSLVSKSMLSVL